MVASAKFINIVIRSSILWLLKVAPDGSATTTQLSSANGANLFPGNILPDGQGNVLATWTISNVNPPPAPQPYQAAYVSSGAVANTYPMPMAPTQLVNGADGLPINPTLVMGENGIVFASYGANITAFNLGSGSVSWNYPAASQSSLSLISYSNGGGLVAKTTTSGADTVLRFDSGGNATAEAWTGSNVDYSGDKSFWIGDLPSTGFGDVSARAVDPTPSLFPAPKQKRLNRAHPISIKVNFGGSNFTIPKTPDDHIMFLNFYGPCSEDLGPAGLLPGGRFGLLELESRNRGASL